MVTDKTLEIAFDAWIISDTHFLTRISEDIAAALKTGRS